MMCRVITTHLLLLSALGMTSPVMAERLYQFEAPQSGERLLTNQVDPQQRPLGSLKREFTRTVKVTWYPDTNVHAYPDDAGIRPRRHSDYDDLVQRAAQRHRLSEGLIKAVIHTESAFNPWARSAPGAQGLMQLMPATAARYQVRDVWDPAENIMAGSRHLRYLLDRYGSLSLALAAYNAGEGNVRKYGGIPPFPETRDYVAKVTRRYHQLYGGQLMGMN